MSRFFIRFHTSQVPPDDMAQECLCSNCPDVPDEYSKCCLYEAKNEKGCTNEGVPCITKVGKMAKVWDKVSDRKYISRNWSILKIILGSP